MFVLSFLGHAFHSFETLSNGNRSIIRGDFPLAIDELIPELGVNGGHLLFVDITIWTQEGTSGPH